MTKIFIDGSSGTTGLNIRERLKEYSGIEIISLPPELYKDNLAKAEAINQSDITILCLPDLSAKESVSLCTNKNTVIIDTSTAHRTLQGWTYGFPELTGNIELIKNSKRIANPGCHASGFISLIAPLTENGIINKDTVLSCFSLTGYTGGGKNMIKEYETEEIPLNKAPRLYGLSQSHKHLPEMMKYGGLTNAPAFCPIVAPFPRGMEVVVTLNKKDLLATESDIREVYKNYYTGNIIKYNENADENGFLSASKFANTDQMEISVFGSSENLILVSRFDNLGKGACGSVIQNLNIVLGEPQEKGLVIK